MKLMDDAGRIRDALRQISGATVSTQWPRQELKGPVLLVTLAGETGADWRDDRETLTELEYYVRIFAARESDMRRLCAAVQTAMEALGYERTMRWEEPGEGWRQTVIRYRTYV